MRTTGQRAGLPAPLRRADEAEDVLQRTFLDIWRYAGRYDPRERFTGWLFTIAHRRAVDTLRAHRLDVPIGTVKARSSRGLHRLSTIMRATETGDAP